MSVTRVQTIRNIVAASIGPQVIAILIAGLNLVAIAERFDALPWSERAVLQICNLGQLLAVAWASSLVLGTVKERFEPRRWHVWLALFVLALLLGFQVLPECFDVFAEKQAARVSPRLTSVALIVLTSLTIPVAAALGNVLGRPRWRWLGLTLAVAISLPNNVVLDGDYWGLHLLATLCSLTLGCASLLNTQWQTELALLRRIHGPALRAAGRTALGVSLLLALLGIGWPSSSALQRLATIEGAPLASRVTWLHSLFQRGVGEQNVLKGLPKESRQWFGKVAERTPVAPSTPTLLPSDPIVLFITIDSLRADIFRQAKWVEGLRFFKGLQHNAVTFGNAQSPASSTVPTLSSVFSCKYYSSLWWEPIFEGGDVWPLKDDSPRFPELLTQHGVQTINIATKSWLMSKRRVVAGFTEEYDLDQNAADRHNHVLSDVVLQRTREALEKPRTGPTFLYSHYMDPHSPYTSGKVNRGSNKKKLYMSEIERLDEELDQFQHWLEERGLASRVVWIVSADHGEAFGDHGVTFHAKNLYDELVHVPLWIQIPGLSASKVQAPVSLLDVGPTVLDLFGVETPGHYMGQSLVPFLRGERPKLSRPIAAETHLKQSLLFADGYKAIRDQRSGAREVYNLEKDPKESKNLIDKADAKYQATLDLFFRTQLHPKYKQRAPYRH